MGKGTLRKKLAKGKHKATIPISIRLSVETAQALDEIEQATELNYDWWLRMLARQLVRHWQEHRSITVPIEVRKLMETNNAKQTFSRLRQSRLKSATQPANWHKAL